MTEFASSCHSLGHARANVVVLESVGGIDRAKVDKLEDVFKCIILTEDSRAIVLLIFDFLLLYCLICAPTFEALGLVFCRVVVIMHFRCVDLHSSSSSAREVADLASERSVLNVQVVFDFELFDCIRMQVAPRLPRVILGLVVRPS